MRGIVEFSVAIVLRLPALIQASPPSQPSLPREHSHLTTMFQQATGWIGGDVAASIPLPDGRIVWLFGDSLIGTARDGHRHGAAMVNNAIGTQTPRQADDRIHFFVGPVRAGKPTAIFAPPEGTGWYWPQSGIAIGSRIYIFLARIEKSVDPGVFGFRQTAQCIAIVEDPTDPPDQWKPRLVTLSNARFDSGHTRCFGTCALVDAGHVYVFGYDEHAGAHARRRLLVARAEPDSLADPVSWRYFDGKEWDPSPEQAAPLLDHMATEFSVTPDPRGSGFVLVWTEDGLSDKILGACAAQPQGPWSAPQMIYRCPEMKRDAGVFTYGAKAHAWAADGPELVVTYCQNTWKFPRLFEDDAVYRPKAIRAALPEKSR